MYVHTWPVLFYFAKYFFKIKNLIISVTEIISNRDQLLQKKKMNTMINEDLLRTIISTSEHLADASSIHVCNWHTNGDVVKPGDNFATQLSRLTVHYRRQQEQERQDNDKVRTTVPPIVKTFILKMPEGAKSHERAKKMHSYDNEMAMYTKVLPHMYTIEDEYFTPRLYYFDDKDSLVLKDLCRSGYRSADRVQQLDFEHSFYAFKTLAKFHALSVKVEKTYGLPEVVKHDPTADLDPFVKPDENNTCFLKQIQTFIDSLPQNLRDQYPNMVAYLTNLMTLNAWKNLVKAHAKITPFNVLNHGDFWSTNMMFKYDKYGSIKKVKLIDFQLTSWRSPVKDLIFFTITSMQFQVYQKYFSLLLKVYLDTLNKALRKLDCPVYSMESLLDDMDSLHDVTLIILCCMLPQIIADPNDPIDLEEMSKGEQGSINSKAKVYKQQRFRDVSAKWFEHFGRTGTLRIIDENI